MSAYNANFVVDASGMRKPQAKKTITAQSASPGYFPNLGGNRPGIFRDAKPRATVTKKADANRTLL
jgi:hypothetical protein